MKKFLELGKEISICNEIVSKGFFLKKIKIVTPEFWQIIPKKKSNLHKKKTKVSTFPFLVEKTTKICRK